MRGRARGGAGGAAGGARRRARGAHRRAPGGRRAAARRAPAALCHVTACHLTISIPGVFPPFCISSLSAPCICKGLQVNLLLPDHDDATAGGCYVTIGSRRIGHVIARVGAARPAALGGDGGGAASAGIAATSTVCTVRIPIVYRLFTSESAENVLVTDEPDPPDPDDGGGVSACATLCATPKSRTLTVN